MIQQEQRQMAQKKAAEQAVVNARLQAFEVGMGTYFHERGINPKDIADALDVPMEKLATETLDWAGRLWDDMQLDR